jgi:hypothetical protein
LGVGWLEMVVDMSGKGLWATLSRTEKDRRKRRAIGRMRDMVWCGIGRLASCQTGTEANARLGGDWAVILLGQAMRRAALRPARVIFWDQPTIGAGVSGVWSLALWFGIPNTTEGNRNGTVRVALFLRLLSLTLGSLWV